MTCLCWHYDLEKELFEILTAVAAGVGGCGVGGGSSISSGVGDDDGPTVLVIWLHDIAIVSFCSKRTYAVRHRN